WSSDVCSSDLGSHFVARWRLSRDGSPHDISPLASAHLVARVRAMSVAPRNTSKNLQTPHEKRKSNVISKGEHSSAPPCARSIQCAREGALPTAASLIA